MPVERERTVEPERVQSEVKQPPTAAEVFKQKLDKLKGEGDDARAERRAAEMARHFEAHKEGIAMSHTMYPVPDVPFNLLSEEMQERWNKRRTDIDQANRAYHLACQRTHAEHRQEDQHIAKLHAEAAAANA